MGYDKCQVYTRFFDTCWRDEDGPKADAADIIIRMMATGDKPRQNTGDGYGATEQSATASDQNGANPAPTPEDIALQFKPDGLTDEEWQQHLAIMRQLGAWNVEHPDDEPFIDPIELQDPRVRMWREILREQYNFNKRQQNEQPETSD